MKLQINRETLLNPLQTVIGAIERRQTLPILSHVLLQRSGTRLTLTGTDLEIQLKAHADIDAGPDESITVQAGKLRDILKLLPDGAQVAIDQAAEKLTLKTAKSRFTLQTLPAENYPAFDMQPPEASATLPANRLKRALDKTGYAMANGDVRYYLNGMLFEFDGATFRTVASDGHRLALHEETLTGEPHPPRQVIIPRKGILELARLVPDSELPVTVATSSNAVTVTIGPVTFTAKLIEGRFPDFRRVMPRDTPHSLIANKETLKASLSRIAIIQGGEKIKSVSMEVKNGAMTLQSQNAEFEEATEELEVQQEGGAIGVGFNITYLLDALNNVDIDQVTLSFPDEMTSCLIEDQDDDKYKFIVMPMKL